MFLPDKIRFAPNLLNCSASSFPIPEEAPTIHIVLDEK